MKAGCRFCSSKALTCFTEFFIFIHQESDSYLPGLIPPILFPFFLLCCGSTFFRFSFYEFCIWENIRNCIFNFFNRNNFHPGFNFVLHLLKINFIFFRNKNSFIPFLFAASSFSVSPPIGRTFPRRVISPVIATSFAAGFPLIADRRCHCHCNSGRRAVFWNSAFGQVNVNFFSFKEIRINSESFSRRTNIT